MAGAPIIIDVEASGFGAGSYPIEVGFALSDGRTRCTLIQPAAEWTHWDTRAEAVHGISRETLRSHGRPIREVADMLNDALGGRTVYTDAWGHDSGWLALLFGEACLPQRFRLESLRALLHESQLAHWNACRARALAEVAGARHRASRDALVIQRAYVLSLEKVNADGDRVGGCFEAHEVLEPKPDNA